MAKTFSAKEWYRKGGMDKRVKAKTAGLTYQLTGQLLENTDAALAKLAEVQTDSVKVNTPKALTESEQTELRNNGRFSGKEVAALIIGCATAETVEGFSEE